MSRYRRALVPGATYFFTVTLVDRSSHLLLDEIDRLRVAYAHVQETRPFESIAVCVLPDHLHAVWALPANDGDFPGRWAAIKSAFSRGLSPASELRTGQRIRREKGIWQRRYWEHLIRDADDLRRHVDYTYFNPVKHGLVARVVDWPHSSFHRDVRRGVFMQDWGLAADAITEDFGE